MGSAPQFTPPFFFEVSVRRPVRHIHYMLLCPLLRQYPATGSMRRHCSPAMVRSEDLEAAHKATVQRLVSQLRLSDWNYAAGFGVDAVARKELRCVIEGFEAPPSSAVSWCSALCISRSADDECTIDECAIDTKWLSDVTVWCTPTDDVPHLSASIGVTAGSVNLKVELMPRLDGGYDAAAEAAGGAYPEPDSRETFTMAAVRSTFEDTYFTPAAFQWRHDIVGQEHGRGQFGAAEWPWRGPLCVDVTLPLAELGRAVTARDAAVEMWLSWKAAASARPLAHVQLTRVYKRDTAVRKAFSAYTEKVFCAEFGYILGQSLAVAHAGPEDMARHSQLGGGSGGASDFTRDPAPTAGIVDLGELQVDIRNRF